MPPKFGTSGLRGLVTDLTPDLVGDHVRAFLASCPTGRSLYIGHDLRPSSPDIATFVSDAAERRSVQVVHCGPVPTPALALAAMSDGSAAVMITGSHIPADRNGLKFYTPEGEITKEQEILIQRTLGSSVEQGSAPEPWARSDIGDLYVERYAQAFGPALHGSKIGLYSHSAVGRDLLSDALTRLGADVVELGRSEDFIPVDTEAVSADLRRKLVEWARQGLDAIVSTDGDGDRPLLAGPDGSIVPGDILGQITGAYLGATCAVTPVSSNTGAEAVFEKVVRTRIGSPFVIAGMEQADGAVVGYEANGGFLLGYTASGPAGPLPALMTRDALLPLLAPLVAAKNAGGFAALLRQQPARFTAADRLQDVPTERSMELVRRLTDDSSRRASFIETLGGVEASLDLTDGLRMTLNDKRVIHLRPSGNAPELRLYVEAETSEAATSLLDRGLDTLRRSF